MQRKRRFCRVTCAKEMSRPPQGAYMACKQSHLSRNHGAKTVLCLGDSFPFHLHSIHLSKFTRIYPFFFPLSTFPKFTRNFGGSTAREEGALHSEQIVSSYPQKCWLQRWGTNLQKTENNGDFEKSWSTRIFRRRSPWCLGSFTSEVKVPIIRIWAETNRLRYLFI